MFFKIGILKNFTNFTGKHLCWSLFFIKLACNFIKKRLQHRRFPVKSANFFRTAIFTEHLRWLLLIMLSVRKLLLHVVIHFAVFCQPVNRHQVFLFLNMFMNRDMNKLTGLYVTNDVKTEVL